MTLYGARWFLFIPPLYSFMSPDRARFVAFFAYSLPWCLAKERELDCSNKTGRRRFGHGKCEGGYHKSLFDFLFFFFYLKHRGGIIYLEFCGRSKFEMYAWRRPFFAAALLVGFFASSEMEGEYGLFAASNAYFFAICNINEIGGVAIIH